MFPKPSRDALHAGPPIPKRRLAQNLAQNVARLRRALEIRNCVGARRLQLDAPGARIHDDRLHKPRSVTLAARGRRRFHVRDDAHAVAVAILSDDEALGGVKFEPAGRGVISKTEHELPFSQGRH